MFYIQLLFLMLPPKDHQSKSTSISGNRELQLILQSAVAHQVCHVLLRITKTCFGQVFRCICEQAARGYTGYLVFDASLIQDMEGT